MAFVVGDDLTLLFLDGESDGDGVVVKLFLQLGEQSRQQALHHDGHLLVFDGDKDGGAIVLKHRLHDAHVLGQRRLFLCHRTDEGVPVQGEIILREGFVLGDGGAVLCRA